MVRRGKVSVMGAAFLPVGPVSLESEPTWWRVSEAHPPNPAGFAQSGESWIVSHFWDE
jgi:hypothetical protein